MLHTTDFALCLFCAHLSCLRRYAIENMRPLVPGLERMGGLCCLVGRSRADKSDVVSPSLGLWSTSVVSPRGLVTTMDVSGVTKLYLRDSLKASSVTLFFSGPDTSSLCHKLCTCCFKRGSIVWLWWVYWCFLLIIFLRVRGIENQLYAKVEIVFLRMRHCWKTAKEEKARRENVLWSGKDEEMRLKTSKRWMTRRRMRGLLYFFAHKLISRIRAAVFCSINVCDICGR